MSELPVDSLVTVDQAIAILDAVAVQPRVERVELQRALGLRLAEDLFCDRDYPPFDKAVMDGFAVRSADVTTAPTQLAVVETIAAGHTGQRSIKTGEAAAIMTGAPVPGGADAVVPVERTTRDGDRVVIHQAVKAGQSVALAGSDSYSGKKLLEKGVQLGPAQLAVAATIGAVQLSVYSAPIVAILSTGDELIEIDQVPSGAQIRNSNSILLQALLTQMGCRVRDLGMVADDPAKMRTLIEQGLESDALLVTGGMSMGERDYVPRIFRDIGLKLEISKLRIKPGKPFVFARGEEGRLAFGLPGNPVSAFVCTVRLASRLLRRMAGGPAAAGLHKRILATDLSANGTREFYLPAYRDGEIVTPLHPNGSADLFTLARADCLILRPENDPARPKGDHIIVIDV